jgi:hypothetical protein
MSYAEVKWYGPKVINQVDNAIQAAMMKAVLMVEADAKRLVNVDTGRLRASITHQVRQITRDIIEGRVGTNISYAVNKMLSFMVT